MSTIEDLKDEVAQGMLEAHKTSGYVLDEDPQAFDTQKFREALLELVITMKVTSRADKDKNAKSKAAFTRLVHPNVPGAKPGELAELDLVGRTVWEKLETQVWTASNPYQSQLQTMVGDRLKGWVLVKGPIIIEEEGSKVQGVYVTNLEGLIIEDFAQPLEDSLVRATQRLGKQLAMVAKRKPEMAKRLTRELSSTLTNSQKQAMSIYLLNAPDVADEADEPE